MKPSPFLDKIRQALRTRHYSYQTEKVYIYWILHFIRYHNKLHPQDLNNPHIEQFLDYLSCYRKVSASTQNLALCSLIFMYRHVIHREIEGLKYKLAKRPKNMPSVLSASEVETILSHLKGQSWLITALLFGTGLRISELLSLRVKDIDFSLNSLFVLEAKAPKTDIPFCQNL